MNKTYTAHQTSSGKSLLINGYLQGSVFLTLSVISLLDEPFLGAILSFYTVKYFFYRIVDFFFSKTIFQSEQEFHVRMCFINFKLNSRSPVKDRATFLVIEDVGFPRRGYVKDYGLVLVRNREKWHQRLFKNKIKLYIEDGKMNLEQLAEQIGEKFNIHFIGKYESY